MWYSDLLGALARAADAEPCIRVRRPCRVTALEQRHESVAVHLDDAAPIDACVAIHAEGSAAGNQLPSSVAILANLDIVGLKPGLAVERFTPEGPLALLPTPSEP